MPSGSGDVPRANYRTLAALAVMRGQIKKEQMEEFVGERGMIGYAPTRTTNDGKFHRIEVQVDRPGVRVLTRRPKINCT